MVKDPWVRQAGFSPTSVTVDSLGRSASFAHHKMQICVLKVTVTHSLPSRSVSRQAEGAGGDQELHHPVSGQRSLPDQHAGQQCPADARHPGLAAPPHGVLHQPHLTGRQQTHRNYTD